MLSSKLKKITYLSLEILGVSVAIVLLISSNPPFQETSDDSAMLFQFLERQQGKQVLGANSKTEEFPCPEARPIIGWINYAGKKEIRKYLPPEISASACFLSIQEANSQGYYEIKN